MAAWTLCFLFGSLFSHSLTFGYCAFSGGQVRERTKAYKENNMIYLSQCLECQVLVTEKSPTKILWCLVVLVRITICPVSWWLCVDMLLLCARSSRENLFLINRTCLWGWDGWHNCPGWFSAAMLPTAPAVACICLDHVINKSKTYYSRSYICCCYPYVLRHSVPNGSKVVTE